MSSAAAGRERARSGEFLHPRFWPTWFGLALLYALHRLPWRWQLAIGAALGDLLRLAVRERVRVARTNLALCFPERSPRWRARLVRAHFRAVGMSLPETAMSWWGGTHRLRGLVDVEGMEHLTAALAEGRGAILATGHFTTMELCAHALQLEAPFDAMYRPMKNRLMDAVVKRARDRRGNTRIFARNDPRTLMRSLRENRVVWYGYDQNYGARHSVFVPFFAEPAATIVTTARFARATGARVVPYFPQRLPDGRYRVTVLPALEGFPGGDDHADARRLNALLEAAVMTAPEQYFWMHRRFKTRPPGAPRVY